MTKLSMSLMAASAALTAIFWGAAPASADVTDRDTETRGGLLGGVQTPTVTSGGSFVHRGKVIVWVPNATATTPKPVVAREDGAPSPRIRASTAHGAFVQNGKTTRWVPSEDLAEMLRRSGPSGGTFNPNSRVVLLGGAETHQALLANLSGGYVVASGALTQPPAVTKDGAFIHTGKTIRWVPRTDPGAMLGQ